MTKINKNKKMKLRNSLLTSCINYSDFFDKFNDRAYSILRQICRFDYLNGGKFGYFDYRTEIALSSLQIYTLHRYQ